MTYYFLGIGGIGMSALARFFKGRGDTVYGYDRTPSALTKALEREGIAIHYSNAPELIPQNVDIAIYTPAVPTDFGEMDELRRRGVPLKKRSQALGELTRGKRCVAVAGSHGKTTTSTMIAHLLYHSGIGCSAFLGGISKNFGSNLHVDESSDIVVVEADEYDRSFLQLHPYVAVITATDADHLDIYHDHEHLLEAYLSFANQVVDEGTLICKKGIFHRSDGSSYINAKCGRCLPSYSTYSATDTLSDYYATNIHSSNGNILFDLHIPGAVIVGLKLNGAPLVNVENAVAAAAVALSLGVTEQMLRSGLESFMGVNRRFDYRVSDGKTVYIDDYAHHPEEIRATIEAVRFLYPGKRVVGIFQPHLYSRTRDLAPQFAQVLNALDAVILLPIYPAREEPIPGVNSEMLLSMMESTETHLLTANDVLNILPSLHADVLLTLGAGDIDRLVPKIEQTLKEHAI